MKGGLEELQFKVSIEDCGKGQDCRPNDPHSASSKETVRIYHTLLPPGLFYKTVCWFCR